MRADPSVERLERWTITQQGREDLRLLATCHCRPRIMGLYVECIDCGTVVGHLRDVGMGNFSNKTRRD